MLRPPAPAATPPRGQAKTTPPGLQFGLQFTTVRPSSAEYAPPGWAAARTPMNAC